MVVNCRLKARTIRINRNRAAGQAAVLGLSTFTDVIDYKQNCPQKKSWYFSFNGVLDVIRCPHKRKYTLVNYFSMKFEGFFVIIN